MARKGGGLLSFEPGSDEMFRELQEMLGADSVAQMQDMLGLTKHQFYRYKKQGLVPYEEVVKFCVDEGKSIDEFMYGSLAGDGMVLELGGDLVRARHSDVKIGRRLAAAERQWLESHRPSRGHGPLQGIYVMADPSGTTGSTDLPGYLIVQLTDPSRGTEIFDEGDTVIVLVKQFLVVRRIRHTSGGFQLTSDSGGAVEKISDGDKNAPVIVGKVLASTKMLSHPLIDETVGGLL